MAYNFIIISVDELEEMSNVALEKAIAIKTNASFSYTITKFVILTFNSQSAQDLSSFIAKTIDDYDAIVITNNSWILCKFKK